MVAEDAARATASAPALAIPTFGNAAEVPAMANATVLIADDEPDFVLLLSRFCEKLGLRVLSAADGLDALMSALRDHPDLLILDINMPGGDGLSVAEKLLRDPKIRPVPVIFCSGRDDPETLARCRKLGGHHVTKGTDLWPQLRSMIAGVLGLGDVQPPAAAAPALAPAPQWRSETPATLARILFVDDDEDMQRILQIRLRACGIEVITASSAMQGLWMAMKEPPQVIVTDYRMPEGSGEYLIGRLRAAPALSGIPIIVLTGASGGLKRDYALERRFLGEYGVSAFLSKPLKFEEMLEALARHIDFDPTVWRKASALRQRTTA
jgi:CheY-like chemotaxis protein